MKYLKNFNTLLEYEDTLILDVPNTSYIVEENVVKYSEELKVGSKYILYKSSDGNVVTPYYTNAFGTSLISNNYDDFGLMIFDDAVTSIGDSAFRNCTSLASITIPNSVTRIGTGTFNGCSFLTSITIPNSVTSIGGIAFSNCSSLTSIEVESGNTTYDSRNNCNAIIETATNTLIAGCQNTTIPNTVTSIGDDAFYNCSSLTSITIPNSVTSIGGWAFYDCSSLTSVTIPNGVTSIEGYAFRNCTSLTSVTIPNSVTSIGSWAFHWCSSLTSIVIGNGVTSIGEAAFDWCFSITTITCEAATPPTLEANNNLSNVTVVYVPAESVDTYKTATNWSYYADKIQPIQ